VSAILREERCIGHAFHRCDKVSDINNLREERFILAHSFRGFSPIKAGRVVRSRVAHIMMARKQRVDA
jgi:hypothetical protein